MLNSEKYSKWLKIKCYVKVKSVFLHQAESFIFWAAHFEFSFMFVCWWYFLLLILVNLKLIKTYFTEKAKCFSLFSRFCLLFICILWMTWSTVSQNRQTGNTCQCLLFSDFSDVFIDLGLSFTDTFVYWMFSLPPFNADKLSVLNNSIVFKFYTEQIIPLSSKWV